VCNFVIFSSFQKKRAVVGTSVFPLVDGERADAVIVAGPHYSFACGSLPGGLVSSFDLNQGLAVCPGNVSNR
jgi:hypothetical protein